MRRGFTLLELIIVIAILAVLAVAVVIVLNPAETLARARDATRLSDLNATKSAIGLFLTDVSGTDLLLDTATVVICASEPAVTTVRISYSTSVAQPATVCGAAISSSPPLTIGTDVDGETWSTGPWCRYTTGSGAPDGTGWIPVNLTKISSGSPLSNFPVDPVNKVATGDTADNPDSITLAYRYACQNKVGTASTKPQYVWEIDAQLESQQYRTTNDIDGNDGGDNADYYENGSSLRILPTGLDF